LLELLSLLSILASKCVQVLAATNLELHNAVLGLLDLDSCKKQRQASMSSKKVQIN
jgi:hypothetical protein